jgi:hypothetical protein
MIREHAQTEEEIHFAENGMRAEGLDESAAGFANFFAY